MDSLTAESDQVDDSPWWDLVTSARVDEWTPWQVVGGIFIRAAARGGPPARAVERGGRLRDEKMDSTTFAQELGLRPLFCADDAPEIFGTADTYVTWQLHGQAVHIESLTRSEAAHAALVKWCDEQILDHREDSPEGPIFSLQRGMDGLRLLRLGGAGVPLVRTNYSNQAVGDFDHVASELKASSPCGRIVLMSGPAGTGKTHMIRALLRESPQGIFILVPPNMLEGIGDPSILPAILDVRDESSGPIVFVLEDADMCFVPRGSDNMASISALLNLGDGILGSLLDMRILATTNAQKFEMDKALLRHGRLCRHIELTALTPTQATASLGAICQLTEEQLQSGWLSEHEVEFGAATTLADVYMSARKLGWEPTPEPSLTVARRMRRRLRARTRYAVAT